MGETIQRTNKIPRWKTLDESSYNRLFQWIAGSNLIYDLDLSLCSFFVCSYVRNSKQNYKILKNSKWEKRKHKTGQI